MALTDSEKNDILFFLGWPSKTLVPNSTHYHKTVVDRMNDLTTEGEDLVRRNLRELKKLDDEISQARCRLAASSVDGIQMNKQEIACLLKERKRYRNELHRTVDIPVLTNDASQIRIVV